MWKKMEDGFNGVLAVTLLALLTAIPVSQSALVEVEPRALVTLPGQTVQVLCKVAIPLQYCRIIVPGYETVNLHPKIVDEAGGLRYFGAGLAAGQCGATITNIQDKNNGVIHCTMGSQSELQESVGSIQLLVAKPPKSPELDVSRGSVGNQMYAAGEVIQAACYIRDGRPAANISWFLDDELLRDGLSDPITINGVDELQTVQQNLTRRLQTDDNGKQLRCVADHIALQGRISQSSVMLNVKYPPQPPTENPIDKFGFEIGKPGTISVDILANPRPLTQWTIDNIQVKEGTADPSGRFEAASVEDLGRGLYRANLHIASIKKEDTEMQFRLTAINDHGSTDYNIVVSTSAEQKGLELGAGPIVGICISVLLVLLIVFLIIYARASGRWCFGERAPSNPNYESSDTESAHVEGQKKKRFQNLKSMFAKKSEIPDSEPVTEGLEDDEGDQVTLPEEGPEGEKKDAVIVYAELDLVKPGGGVKPVVRKEDEKTEYAEIIYTKNDTSTEDLPKESK